MATTEIRRLPTPPTADPSNPGLLTGYVATFNTRSNLLSEKGRQFQELILPGAFSRALSAGGIVALWDHGRGGRPPLGRMPSTLKLWEDARGLAFSLDLPASAADVREAVARGDVEGMSFGFSRAVDRWSVRDGIQVRELLDVGLVEISPTIIPAYPGTSVGVRDYSAVEVPAMPPSPLSRACLKLAILERE